MIEAIDKEMKRLEWSVEDGKRYISDRYNSKSRRLLSDEELMEFWQYLKQKRAME